MAKTDDLERYIEAVRNGTHDWEKDTGDRKITYSWKIEGTPQQKKALYEWFDSLWTEGHLGNGSTIDNPVLLYGTDPKDHKSIDHSYWKKWVFPFDLQWTVDEDLALDMDFDLGYLASYNGCHNEDALTAHKWLQKVIIDRWMKPFGLTLSGFFDNSHRRYVVTNNLVSIEESKHFVSTVDCVIINKQM